MCSLTARCKLKNYDAYLHYYYYYKLQDDSVLRVEYKTENGSVVKLSTQL